MKLPKKIYPDNIKDSIVEIRFKSQLPFEIALGFFYKALDDTYMYTNRQSLPLHLPDGSNIEFSQRSINLFYNNVIKFELRPNSVVFNCIDEYKGWEVYEVQIKETLLQLLSANVIEYFERVGVRYISEYKNEEIQKITKFNFTFGFPQIKSNSYSFNCNFNWDEMRVALNLNNNKDVSLPLGNIQKYDFSILSYIDVDIIKENFQTDNLNELVKFMNLCHEKEKEIFFGLLDKEYLTQLKKEY